MSGPASQQHAFVAPALHGPPTGGTIYNAALIAALREAGVRCTHFELRELPPSLDAAADVLWVDSLYLEAMPALRARLRGAARLHLLLHYLPSCVRAGRAVTRSEASQAELAALSSAGAVLVTSPFMQGVVRGLGLGALPVLCVEPGTSASPPPAAARTARRSEPLALMLCNVTSGKGVLPLLAALAAKVRDRDRFSLVIAGSLEAEPAYAAACRAAIEASEHLRTRVELLGALPRARALALLQRSDALLSASRMESYGMALAEARAAGVPVLARGGGHAAAHVDARAGGELVSDEAELATSWLALVREPPALLARQRAAAARLRARPWSRAAGELLAQLAALG